MAEREFLIYHASKGKKIIEFRIQLEILVKEAWYPIVRYDTAHGKAHRDILYHNGQQSKDWFEGYSIEEVLTIGQKDILENWSVYRDRYVKEMKK